MKSNFEIRQRGSVMMTETSSDCSGNSLMNQASPEIPVPQPQQQLVVKFMQIAGL